MTARESIISALRSTGRPMDTEALAEVTGLLESTTRCTLTNMAKSGVITGEAGSIGAGKGILWSLA